MIFHYPAGHAKTYALPFHSRGLELGCVRVRVGLGFGLVLELEVTQMAKIFSSIRIGHLKIRGVRECYTGLDLIDFGKPVIHCSMFCGSLRYDSP